MRRTQVTFDGWELTSLFAVSDLQAPLLPRTLDSMAVPGHDGSLLAGVRLAPRSIKLRLTVLDKTIEGRQAASRMLASILAVSEPKPLALSIDEGLWYLAMPNAKAEGGRYRNAITYDVEFVANDPVAYGAQKVVTVPSGGSVAFNVGGTYHTMPLVSAPAAANGTGGFWRLRLDDGSYLIATVPGGVSTASVVADCERRTLKVGGATALLVPAADWLVLEPGERTLQMTGTGAATVTYYERWV
jgi:predicted phage tail component-like protein